VQGRRRSAEIKDPGNGKLNMNKPFEVCLLPVLPPVQDGQKEKVGGKHRIEV